ncbi:hypothetical protein RND71_025955 [Anisodus tanguticus]|uniref:Uncharacterized protein n=1 Tax=Anisodus tanguticus TaxID=243964 RepID=A0AAE1RLD3_9SOLA|nr:hypothetical protein RND71_025955 [Anisodus tanguticus]
MTSKLIPDMSEVEALDADFVIIFVSNNSVVGIRSTITRLSQLLKEHDAELWQHLEVTTNSSILRTVIFIWDTLLSDPEGPQDWCALCCNGGEGDRFSSLVE